MPLLRAKQEFHDDGNVQPIEELRSSEGPVLVLNVLQV